MDKRATLLSGRHDGACGIVLIFDICVIFLQGFHLVGPISPVLDAFRCGQGSRGGGDIWQTTRASTDDPWSEPVNLGLTINGPYYDTQPSISADGLSLFFASDRPDGYGDRDIWFSTRATINDPWSEPKNLGAGINSPSRDSGPDISSDGLTLFFDSRRPGGYGLDDVYVTRRATTDDPWGVPKNLGPIVNNSNYNYTPCISTDGSILYFSSNDYLRQAPIIPIVDFNGDGNIDTDDLLIMIDNWGTDESLCDIGPTPLGDGVVDIEDLTVFIEYWEQENFPEIQEVNVDEDDDGGQVTLEQGQNLVVTLESNPSTGYQWEVVENQNSILEQEGDVEFKPSEQSDPPIVGAGGWEIFRFKAVSAGQETVQLVYRRSWEEGVEPINTFSIEVIVN